MGIFKQIVAGPLFHRQDGRPFVAAAGGHDHGRTLQFGKEIQAGPVSEQVVGHNNVEGFDRQQLSGLLDGFGDVVGVRESFFANEPLEGHPVNRIIFDEENPDYSVLHGHSPIASR